MGNSSTRTEAVPPESRSASVPPHGAADRARPSRPVRSDRGFTLAELLVVIALLSVVAAVALPVSMPQDGFTLEAAAQETADAIRWARAEAIRSGSLLDATGQRIVGFDVSTSTQHVRVSGYSGYARGSTATNPVDKKSYDLDLANDAATRGVTIASAVFANQAGASAGTVAIFDADGNPFQFNVGGTPSAISPLTAGTIVLSLGRGTRTVTLDATGRVTVTGG
jgi:prepilin-type N-terminal cleavage/methylation domain-containing protein